MNTGTKAGLQYRQISQIVKILQLRPTNISCDSVTNKVNQVGTAGGRSLVPMLGCRWVRGGARFAWIATGRVLKNYDPKNSSSKRVGSWV